MNPIFVVLVFLAGAGLWLLCSFLFRPVGKISKKLIEDAKDAITKDEEKEKEET